MKKSIVLAVAIAFLANLRCSEVATGGSASVIGARQCGICHALPPNDPGHAAHWDSLTDRHFSCGACHKGYEADSASGSFRVDSLTHMNGVVDVVFSAPWNDSGKAVYDPGLKQCSNVYCHGAFHQGTRATVVWGGADTTGGSCAQCHDLASINTGHYVHALQPVYQGSGPTRKLILGGKVNICESCHAGYSVINRQVNSMTHINGVVEEPTCAGVGCHISSEWTTWSEYLKGHPTPPVAFLLKALEAPVRR